VIKKQTKMIYTNGKDKIQVVTAKNGINNQTGFVLFLNGENIGWYSDFILLNVLSYNLGAYWNEDDLVSC
jgi:hypothetical protein